MKENKERGKEKGEGKGNEVRKRGAEVKGAEEKMIEA